jgi:RNA polymerase sigma-70 factor (ECF subfamily)
MDLRESIKLGQFLEEVSTSISKIIFAHFPNLTREDREEVGQEVKLKILKMAENGKIVDNPRSYIWKMVYTTALDVLNERLKFCPLEGLQYKVPSPRSIMDFDCPQSLFEAKELESMIDQTIDSLPRRKKVVILLHLQGLDLEEMAEFLGWSQNIVRHLLYRGLAELKRKVNRARLPRPAARYPEPEKTA